MPPPVYTHCLFSCLCLDSGWWRCSRDWGLSPPLSGTPHSLSLSLSCSFSLSLSLPLYKWRLSVFIVQRVTRQPADGGLPWPRWTSGASFRNRRSLGDSQPHRQGSPHYHCWGILLCVCLFVWQISLHYYEVFIEPKKAWIGICMLTEKFFFLLPVSELLTNGEWLQKEDCLLCVSSQLFVLQLVRLFQYEVLVSLVLKVVWTANLLQRCSSDVFVFFYVRFWMSSAR